MSTYSSIESLVSAISTDEKSEEETKLDEKVSEKATKNFFGKIDRKLDYQFAEKKRGENGTRCKVLANFSPVTIQEKTIVYQYNIEINVHDRVQNAADSRIPQRNRIKQQKKMINDSNFEIFNQFVLDEKKKKEESIFMSEPIFDGKKIIYSKTKLKFNDRITKEVKLRVPERKLPTTFVITITTPRDSHVIDLSILNNTKNLRSAEKELQAVDIIITYGAKKFNLFYNSNMFKKKQDLYSLSEEERNKIRFNVGNLKEGCFGSYQVSLNSFSLDYYC